MVIDIVWVIFYYNNLWNTLWVDNGSQAGVRKWTCICSAILPFTNLILFICLCYNAHIAPGWPKNLRI